MVFAPLILSGFVIGVLSGLFGIGGGSLMTPVFRIMLGLSPTAATATSLFTIIPTSISGGISHVKHKTCIPKLAIVTGIGGAFTSAIGVYLNVLAPGWLIIVFVSGFIIYTSITMLKKAIGFAGKSEEDIQAVQAKSESNECLKIGRKHYITGFLVGMIAGIGSGFMGIGGGFIIIPCFINLLHLSIHKVSGTSLLAIVLIVIPGIIVQAAYGHIDYLAGLLMALGTIPGAILGTHLVSRVSEKQLSFLFAGFLIIVAFVLLANEFGILSV